MTDLTPPAGLPSGSSDDATPTAEDAGATATGASERGAVTGSVGGASSDDPDGGPAGGVRSVTRAPGGRGETAPDDRRSLGVNAHATGKVPCTPGCPIEL